MHYRVFLSILTRLIYAVAQFSFYSHVSQICVVVAMRSIKCQTKSRFLCSRTHAHHLVENKLMTKCRSRIWIFLFSPRSAVAKSWLLSQRHIFLVGFRRRKTWGIKLRPLICSADKALIRSVSAEKHNELNGLSIVSGQNHCIGVSKLRGLCEKIA